VKRALAAVFLVLTVAAPAAARDPKPADFAYGLTLGTSGSEAIYEFPLPADVYRGVTRSDLGDICVFNGRDEAVPFTVAGPAAPPPSPVETGTLPLFPLFTSRGPRTDGMSLQVRRGRDGSIVRVETSDGTPGNRKISSFLVDAGAVKNPVASLDLEWTTEADGTVARMAVEGSNDLESWSPLVSGATVMSLRYGAHTLERRTVELGGSHMKYYRLSFPGSADIPRLTGVVARLSVSGPEPRRQWVEISANRPAKAGEYAFRLPGQMPVDRLRVRLPQENTLVTATFFSRPTERDPWRPGPTALVYRLRFRGQEISAGEISLPPTTDRYWLMRVDRSGGGIGRGIPVVDFGWRPGRVLFVARGEGPFRMAYGSGRIKECSRAGEDLVGRFSDLRKGGVPAGTAVTGTPYLLGGKAALRRPLFPSDGKTVALWTSLLIGVALLAWMALRLHRQMRDEENRTDKG